MRLVRRLSSINSVVPLLALVLPLWVVCPAAGAKIEDHTWHRLTQDRLELITDLKPSKARDLLRQLELFRGVVERYVPSRDGFDDDLQILLFARRRDFTKLFRPRHFGAFTLPQLTQTRLVVAPSGERASLRKNLLHEYVHYRVRASISRLAPVWFEEGLATLLADVEFDTMGGDKPNLAPDISVLGRWPGYSGLKPFPLQRLFSARGVEDFSKNEAFEFYTTSHHLVRELLLANRFDPAALDGFVFEQSPTIEQLFGRSHRELNRSLRLSYERASPALMVKPLELGQPSADIQIEEVAADEILRLLGQTLVSINPKGAQRLFDRLTSLRSSSTAGWLGRATALASQDKQIEAMRAFEQAQRLEPDAAEVYIARGLLATRDCIIRRDEQCFGAWRGAVADLRRGLFDAPDRFDAIYRLGQAHLYLGQPGEAVNYLAIAATRAPWSARVNYFLGEAYRALGDSRARTHLERAERWAGSEFFRKSAAAALAELARGGGSVVTKTAPNATR